MVWIWVILFNFHSFEKHPINILFYSSENEDPGKWCKLPKATQLVSAKARLKPKQAIPTAHTLNHYISLPLYNRYSKYTFLFVHWMNILAKSSRNKAKLSSKNED